MAMEQTAPVLNQDNLYKKIDPKSPPAGRKVAQWWETIDEEALKDPNRRSSASRESLCQWSIEAQSVSSSCKRRRERASRKERELRERIEKELRNLQRLERKHMKAKMMSNNRGGPIIQDRSKSKAARIREEAKYRKKPFRGESVDFSSSVEFVMKGEGRKREVEDKKEEETRKKRFSAVLEPFQHETRNRPRIVLTQKPRPHQGIFGQGASSAEPPKKEKPIHPKKKMPRPITNSSQSSIIEFNPRLPAAIPKWPGKGEADSQSSKTHSSHAQNRFEEDEIEEKRLRKVLESFLRSKERARRTHMKSVARHTKVISGHDSEDGHSAYSNAKKRQRRLDEGLEAMHKYREVGIQKNMGSETSSQLARHIAREANEESGRAMPRAMDPPPLLAFDGNRPHQHVNSWRAQHSRNEPDPIQLRQEMEDNGGINMRARESLVTARGRQLPREYFGNNAMPQWEVMPANEDLYYSPHQYHLDLPSPRHLYTDDGIAVPPDVVDSAGMEGINDYTLQYNDAPWFDTVYEEPMYNQQDQEGYYQDPYLDHIFDPYTMHQEHVVGQHDVSNLHAYQGERAVAADWFDQVEYEDEGSWCDKISEANEMEPAEVTIAPLKDFRKAIQPTEEDLPGFWKPQV